MSETLVQETRQRPRGGKFLESPFFWILLVGALVSIPLIRSLQAPPVELPPVLGQINNFQLTDQTGRKVSWENDFRGSVLLVNFIFTTCPDVCPLLTAQMAKVQNRLVGATPVIRLVSISVDPFHDTPEKLLEYGKKHNANFKAWSFLTGDLAQLKDTIVHGFKVGLDYTGKAAPKAVQEAKGEDLIGELMAITHGENFVVVDQLGQIRSYRQVHNESDINETVKVLGLVANQRPERK